MAAVAAGSVGVGADERGVMDGTEWRENKECVESLGKACKGVSKALERLWKGFGKALERLWKAFGKPLESLWKSLSKVYEREDQGFGREPLPLAAAPLLFDRARYKQRTNKQRGKRFLLTHTIPTVVISSENLLLCYRHVLGLCGSATRRSRLASWRSSRSCRS